MIDAGREIVTFQPSILRTIIPVFTQQIFHYGNLS
jgi:hypothetical protein